MLGLLRTRRAVERILWSAADIVEHDKACAQVLSEHPESLAALARCVEGVPWASSRRTVQIQRNRQRCPAPWGVATQLRGK